MNTSLLTFNQGCDIFLSNPKVICLCVSVSVVPVMNGQQGKYTTVMSARQSGFRMEDRTGKE